MPHPQVPLDLEDGEPDLDIDTTALPGGRFQHDVLQVLLTEPQRRGGQQQVQVALHVRLGATASPVAEAGDDCVKVESRGRHAQEPRTACLADRAEHAARAAAMDD